MYAHGGGGEKKTHFERKAQKPKSLGEPSIQVAVQWGLFSSTIWKGPGDKFSD